METVQITKSTKPAKEERSAFVLKDFFSYIARAARLPNAKVSNSPHGMVYENATLDINIEQQLLYAIEKTRSDNNTTLNLSLLTYLRITIHTINRYKSNGRYQKWKQAGTFVAPSLNSQKKFCP